MTQETERKMHECVACGHLYEDPAPSSCDCCENKANAYILWVARRAALEANLVESHQIKTAALEAKQAEVKLPEPVAFLHECKKKPSLSSIAFGKASPQLKANGFVDVPLFTEQQVRELLQKANK